MSTSAEYFSLRRSAGAYARGTSIHSIGGAGREAVLSHVIARPTEFAQPGSVVDSLALDDAGRVMDFVLAVVDEDRTLVISENSTSAASGMNAVALALGIHDVTIDALVGWGAIAVEGPRAWEVVRGLVTDDIASLLLNEWQPVEIPGASFALLARTGTTAEYGYVVVADVPSDVLIDSLRSPLEDVGGALVGPPALQRARMEVNHPVVPDQFTGVTALEAGAGWAAGIGREDSYRGAGHAERPHRRLVAIRSTRPLESGRTVEAGGVTVGRVHLCAAEIDGETSYALALLDAPFDVPGLEVTVDGATARTVSRPAVQPVSWTEPIG
nr:aminomethyltransferase family protein [Microbacterium testaceum]